MLDKNTSNKIRKVNCQQLEYFIEGTNGLAWLGGDVRSIADSLGPHELARMADSALYDLAVHYGYEELATTVGLTAKHYFKRPATAVMYTVGIFQLLQRIRSISMLDDRSSIVPLLSEQYAVMRVDDRRESFDVSEIDSQASRCLGVCSASLNARLGEWRIANKWLQGVPYFPLLMASALAYYSDIIDDSMMS